MRKPRILTSATDPQALKAGLRKAQTAATAGYREGVRQARAQATQRIARIRESDRQRMADRLAALRQKLNERQADRNASQGLGLDRGGWRGDLPAVKPLPVELIRSRGGLRGEYVGRGVKGRKIRVSDQDTANTVAHEMAHWVWHEFLQLPMSGRVTMDDIHDPDVRNLLEAAGKTQAGKNLARDARKAKGKRGNPYDKIRELSQLDEVFARAIEYATAHKNGTESPKYSPWGAYTRFTETEIGGIIDHAQIILQKVGRSRSGLSEVGGPRPQASDGDSDVNARRPDGGASLPLDVGPVGDSSRRDSSVREEVTDPSSDPDTFYQIAYHGSPHRGIERFSLQSIGTGEGNQAYGWGMYFASMKKVADWYRQKLSVGGIRSFDADAEDGNSRSDGEGSHNYVIWDEDAIGIEETYYQGDLPVTRGDVARARREGVREGSLTNDRQRQAFTTLSFHLPFLEIRHGFRFRETSHLPESHHLH